ncbi:protodermal factor 1 [Oryza sativa Japonica Group]|uniref:Os02g0230300 protein n=2 Tax=Oryza sativa subsp. japonica TaxID=39947 RepID=C7IYA2_ORYSJ|nr:protodermal factor 1 [Oryza sativa Japonica Group]EAZ22325.1 hypothetical protein OsJ_05979 [Oryza sativa Japonica Group]KAF2943891.1 hypothetical protein DAI22_02g098900 [Oryza sativa Japonica Group]BAD26174.1 putative protodermal factor [Oryza sativa Japonica Group]BAH91596.1 Os02g0230300 [Oryza sativa Japonica Group]|eukprot:NP_001172867.1 Os02g0230300 [Oryza sativa Japonica Group]
MSSKVLLISGVLVGLLSLSSCRSLGELSEQKTYSSTTQYGGSPTPSYGSDGGYKPTPTPTPAYGSTPTPSYGTTPTPSYGTTPTPSYGTTPSTPSTPDVPEVPTKHDFCGSCDYWKNHPDVIISAIGSLGDIGKTLGTACSLITGKKLENLHDALSNTGTDGTGALLREGAAAYLNSIVNKKFPFTTQQVKDCIVVAMTSDGAASSQAEIFKKANDYHY